MELKPEDYRFIKTEEDWNRFVKREKLLEYSAKPVKRASIKGWVKFAFVVIRIYIIVMVVLVFLGFLHVL
ncbi:MAG: hypothetical protein M1559_01560 [Candidatus Marsarchaeota archaeon]|nr:hypothetical protein [Candidatus Marsarchaeota archaeon]